VQHDQDDDHPGEGAIGVPPLHIQMGTLIDSTQGVSSALA
jgi:hypothetical protein